MKIISSPEQTRHDPQQIMLRGRMVKPVEQPERLRVLAQSLAEDGHEAVEPAAHSLDYVRQVHDPDYLHFLSSAFAEWRKLPDAGIEVLPNTHHYRNAAQAGQPPGRLPQTIVGRAGWYVSDLNCAIGEGTWEAIEASARSAIHAAQLLLGVNAAPSPRAVRPGTTPIAIRLLDSAISTTQLLSPTS